MLGKHSNNKENHSTIYLYTILCVASLVAILQAVRSAHTGTSFERRCAYTVGHGGALDDIPV